MTITAEMRAHMRLCDALNAGDLAAVRDALGGPATLSRAIDAYTGDNVMQLAVGRCSPAFLRELIAAGADVNYDCLDGFPSLLSALTSPRDDRHETLRLLLEAGADITQRGINDYTPLHMAASRDDTAAIALLLTHGADPHARTRIDDLATPLEEAWMLGNHAAVAALEAAENGRV